MVLGGPAPLGGVLECKSLIYIVGPISYQRNRFPYFHFSCSNVLQITNELSRKCKRYYLQQFLAIFEHLKK